MANITIRKEHRPTGGRYVATVSGIEGEAELIFTTRGANLLSADHTEAPETMRGSGVAMALVEYMIADARQNGFKVIPLCPYVKAQYRRHPEWADVMAAIPGATPPSPAD